MRVLIRADASQHIGSGHIARCLTLAKVLQQGGSEVLFACRTLVGHQLSRIAGQGFSTLELPPEYPGEEPARGIEALLPWQADIAALQAALPWQAAFDWIIVDHYGLDHHWQTASRQWAARIAVIDDLANRRHAADLLFDQNLTGTAQAYAPWVNADCQQLLGPRYALLRDEFKGAPRAIQAQVRKVLVNFGGFDPQAQTWKAMQALEAFDSLEVDFIAGVGNPAWDVLQARVSQRPGWRLHSYTEDFARLMAQADVFIGAGGGTSWERAALGLPTLCIAVADNQQANAECLAAMGAHLYLGRSEAVEVAQVTQALTDLLDNPGLRQRLAEHSRQLVDGWGAQRFAAVLLDYSKDHADD